MCWHKWWRWSSVKVDDTGKGYQTKTCRKCSKVKVRIVGA